MIKKLHIQNFKSIKDLELDCARVNVFIGEPNTGKSNILESVGILSFGYTGDLKDFVRFEKSSNLFYNNEINKSAKISFKIGRELINNSPFADSIENLTHKIDILYSKDSNLITIKSDGGKNLVFPDFDVTYDAFSSRFLVSGGPATTTMIQYYPIRFFRLNDLKFEKPDDIYILKPPDGRNLMNVLKTNRDVLEFALNILKPYGFQKMSFSLEGHIVLIKEINKISDEIPFELLSDTFIKMIMLYAAIETSSKHVLVLEEPESHMFPHYTQFLAEKIGNNSNQFFMATHNPYFLHTLMEKTSKEELNIFITYYQDYQTKVYKLKENEISEFMDSDVGIYFQIKDLVDEITNGDKK